MTMENEKIQIIISMMDDESPSMRARAITKYAEILQHNSEELLLNKLKTSNVDTDIACTIKALTSISSYAASSIIFTLKDHKSNIVRLEVLKYITKNYITSYESFITASLNDCCLKIRLQALDSINELKLYSAISDVLASTIVSVSSEFIKHSKKVLIDFLVKYPNDHILTSIRDYKPNTNKSYNKYLTYDEDTSSLEFSQIIRNSITNTLINTPDLKTIEIIKNIFNNCTDPKRVINALYALNQFNIDIPTKELVNKVFTGSDPLIKIEIIKSLKNSMNVSWVPMIFDNFDSLEEIVIIEAILSTKDIQSDKIANTLIDELLKCDKDNKKYLDAILSSMAKYDNRKMLKPILIKIKEVGYFSSTFANNLKFFTCVETKQIIYPFLNSSNDKNVINAIKALSKRGNTEAINHLVNSFFGRNLEVKQEIITALGIIESDIALEHLLHISIIEDLKDMLDNIEKSIKLISLSNPDSYPVKLYHNEKKPHIFLKDAAIAVLESLGFNKMFDSLMGIINSNTHFQAKKNAINLLCKSKNPEHIKFVLSIITNKEYPSDVREFTFERIMK